MANDSSRRHPTQQDIADLAGVSRITVSRAIRVAGLHKREYPEPHRGRRYRRAYEAANHGPRGRRGSNRRSNRCSATRQHCCLASGPAKSGVMSVEDTRGYIAEGKKLGLTRRQRTITGGEAMLYYATVLGIVRASADLGMAPVHAVQSIASWCVSDALTRERLTALRAAGLRRWSGSSPCITAPGWETW